MISSHKDGDSVASFQKREPGGRSRPILLLFFLLCLFCARPGFVQADSNFQWTFNDDGGFHYILTAVSSEKVYEGSLTGGVNNPTLRLIVGQRYAATVANPVAHPLEIIAKGISSGSDVVLLAQGGVTGSLESDPEIAWADLSGGVVEFTVTMDLVNAMRQSGLAPGYRCRLHPAAMRGNFEIFGDGERILDPIAARIPLGTQAVNLQPVADGLVSPLGLVDPNDGTGRLFIYDQSGAIHILQDNALLTTPFLDVSARLVTLGVNYDERGLLGFAFHPDFAANGKVYTYTSEPVDAPPDFTVVLPEGIVPNHQSIITEWQVDSGDPNRVDLASRREILRIDQPQSNHNGGEIIFGPDGRLYIALGDGGAADDQGNGHGPDGNGQNPNTILGTVLRIDVNGTTAANGQYAVPEDNPFVGNPDALDEIYAYGFRNPYRMSFDSVTGKLYVADVGQNDIEEINDVIAGGNYGWRLKEGSFFFDPNGTSPGFVTTKPVEPLPADLLDPIAEYDQDDGSAIIGGFVYRGSALPELQERYVFGDFGGFAGPTGRLFYLDESGEPAEFDLGSGGLGLWLKGFGQDRNGEIYICGSTTLGPSGATGTVLKIVPRSAAATDWSLYQD